MNSLIEKRGTVAKVMRSMYDVAEKEGRGFTAEEEEKWKKLEADIMDFDMRIKANNALNEHKANRSDSNHKESAIFRRFLQRGMGDLSLEERQFMQERKVTSVEMRALGTGSGNIGGFTVPAEFLNNLEVAMKSFGGMLNVSEIIYTDTGAVLPMPTLNFTSAAASIVGENTQSPLDASTPFGTTNLGAFTYRTPVLPLSYELLQDSAFKETIITDAFGEQLARGLNAHLTTGTGIGQAEGIITGSVAGKIGSLGSTASVSYDDLVDLEHSVDQSYRNQAKFMFNDDTLKVLKKIKDSNGLPLFVPSISGPAHETILGYQYEVNQDMPTMSANAKSILFGRLDKYKTRIVKDTAMVRLTERYADSLQVGFLGFLRADGRLLDAGTNPVKYYQNSAT